MPPPNSTGSSPLSTSPKTRAFVVLGGSPRLHILFQGETLAKKFGSGGALPFVCDRAGPELGMVSRLCEDRSSALTKKLDLIFLHLQLQLQVFASPHSLRLSYISSPTYSSWGKPLQFFWGEPSEHTFSFHPSSPSTVSSNPLITISLMPNSSYPHLSSSPRTSDLTNTNIVGIENM